MKKPLLLFLFFGITFSCLAQNPTLWGMTPDGGIAGVGNIYQVGANGYAFKNNYSFSGSSYTPTGNLLLASNGLLYGLTPYGGANGDGIIFSYDTLTGIESDLHDFGGSIADVGIPQGSLIQARNGLLYGMTTTNNLHGTIFSFDISTGTETVVCNLVDTAGYYASGSLIQANNDILYGMTSEGGYSNLSDGRLGTLFSYNISTNSLTALHVFSNLSTDGYFPKGSVIQAKDGLLYGMAPDGGTYKNGSGNFGIIFSYNISTNTYTVVHNFGAAGDGTGPFASLVQAGNGLLYGTTVGGGAHGGGTIFSFDITTGTETVVHSFRGINDGIEPMGSLMQASNGLLYGTTQNGNSNGNIFSFNPVTDSVNSIFYFNGSNGKYPVGDLIEYGNTSTGINQVSVNSKQLSVYPNPTSGQLSIISNQLPINEITVTNLLGQIVYKESIAGTHTNLNTNLTEGMYFVTIASGNETTTQKVMVIK